MCMVKLMFRSADFYFAITFQKVQQWPPKRKLRTVIKVIILQVFAAAKAKQKDRPQTRLQVNPIRQELVNPLHLFQHHDTYSDDHQYLYAITGQSSDMHTGSPYATVKIGGQSIPLMANTGASINMLNRHSIEKLKAGKLHPTQVKVYRFTSKELVESRGKFEMVLE